MSFSMANIKIIPQQSHDECKFKSFYPIIIISQQIIQALQSKMMQNKAKQSKSKRTRRLLLIKFPMFCMCKASCDETL
jgi:hypothetical protein